MILLSPSPNSSNSPFDEYLLLEYYTPTGLNKFDCDYSYHYPYDYPQGPKASGIRVWHVDARLAKYVQEGWSYHFEVTTNPPSASNLVLMGMSNTYNGNDVNSNYLS